MDIKKENEIKKEILYNSELDGNNDQFAEIPEFQESGCFPFIEVKCDLEVNDEPLNVTEEGVNNCQLYEKLSEVNETRFEAQKANRSSVIWNLFTIEADESKAKCKLCNKIIARGSPGSAKKSYTTSSLRKHAMKKHPIEFGEAEEKKEIGLKRKVELQPPRNNILKTDINQLKRKSELQPSVSKVLKTDIKQLTLQETYDKSKLWDLNDERSKRISYLIGEMIALDLQPFSMIEGIGFQRLIKHLSPNYKFPSVEYFRETIIPDIYNRVKSEIQTLLTQVKYISITTDGTTSNNFLSITGHWLSDEFTQKTAVIGIVPQWKYSSSSNIKCSILNVLDDIDIPLTKVHLVLHDSAPIIVGATRLAGLNSIPCFLHTLQLVLKDAIFDQQYIKTLIVTCRSIAVYFNRSSHDSRAKKLKEIQKQCNVPEHNLIEGTQRHWNSQYYMLERINEQKKTIMAYSSQNVSDDEIPHLDSKQWLILNKIVKILKPFEEVTKTLGAQHSLCSAIIPTIIVLKHIFKKAEAAGQFTGLATCVTGWQESCSRFQPYLENKELIIATFLDPRFKDKFLYDIEHGEDKREHLSEEKQIETMLEKVVYWLAMDIDYSEEIQVESADSSTSSDDGSADLDFTKCFQKIIKTKIKSSKKAKKYSAFSKPADNLLNNLKQEVERYMRKPILQHSENPLEWWAKEYITFKYLSQAALKYLSSSPSSAESQRIFSGEEGFDSARINRLPADSLEVLMFLHYNLRILSFEY